MKTLIATAAALMLTGSAYAYQTYEPDPAATTAATISVDPTVAFTVPVSWTPEQRALWEQQMDFHPGWSAEQQAMFDAMMAIPPASWTPAQRTLYEQHLTHIPSSWTAEQRTMFEQQIVDLRSPWMHVGHTAAIDTTATTTLAMAPASGKIVQPSNADPEHDARGIAVISDAAVVPDGYNGVSGTGMGGPLVDPATGETVERADNSYPACTATVTDNCIQLYERGVRESLAGYTQPSGGLRTETMAVGGPYQPVGEDEAGDNTAEDDGLDVDLEPDGDLDVDGDLDNDGDNDLE
jgi:hypothetical protein